ncbi:MAG: proline/glycine betaine ABC transporter substrate-binding protein ProX, partial [Acidimicrobiaceae bacterium]|nr:proline/glycine betaine ABC transporter substrate-binding protein ProX [Acidimicrobiaceae bacterium]
MRRVLIAVLVAVTAVSALFLTAGTASGTDDERVVRMARPTWDTGWFQA